MIGAIAGDIIGSRFEWANIKKKEFELFSENCYFTDDSVMTIAIACAIMKTNGDWSRLGEFAIKEMQDMGRRYPMAGYGLSFKKWFLSNSPNPYGSYGNGAAMRVSACGYAAVSLDEAVRLSCYITEVTHNHPEGIKGAEATTVAIWLAKHGKTIPSIKEHVIKNYYPIDFTLDEIRDQYEFDASCQGTVPQALEAFFESHSFEDEIRNAVSIGGDSDTLAAITGSIAGAYYVVPECFTITSLKYLDDSLRTIVNDFQNKYR